MENKLNIQHDNCIDKINKIQDYIKEAWGNFVLCEFDQGMKYFEKIIMGLDEVISYMESIKSQSTLNIDFNHILGVLQKVENSITIKDYVYSADLLKYEIDPILKGWKRLLTY